MDQMNGLPVNKVDVSQNSSDIPYNIPVGSLSVITDETPHRMKIGYVDHVIRETSEPLMVKYHRSRGRVVANASRARYPTVPYSFVDMELSWSVGYRPHLIGFQAIKSGLFDVWASPTSSLPSVGYPASYLVVNKIMNRLNRFNGLTYLLELRDMPHLVHYLSARKSFIALLRNGKALGASRMALQKAIRLVTNRPSGKIAKTFSQLTTTERIRVINLFLTGEFRDAYLGAIFGLIPTVGETASLANELVSDRGTRKKFSVSSREGKTSTSSKQVTVDGYPVSLNLASEQSGVIGARVAVVRRPFTSDDYNATVEYAKSLLGYNPAAALWAIVPFSFVVDWFLHIDDVLDAAWLKCQDGVSTEWWQTSKAEHYATYATTYVAGYSAGPVTVNNSNPPLGAFINGIASGNVRFSRYHREAISQPLGSLKPRFTLPHQGGKVFTLVLLALGLVDRK
jgi:hypothetical protein